MPIKIKNAVSHSNSGDGFRVEGQDIELEGVISYANSGRGFNLVESKTSLMKDLGLPENTDPKTLAELLAQLQGKNSSEAIEVIEKSEFVEKLEGVKDTSILTVNLLTLATHPSVHQLIHRLWEFVT